MTTFEAYKIYLAIRLHFTKSDYDIRKTKGRIKASIKTLEKKPKISFQLQKFCRRYTEEEYIHFLVANFINGDKWGGMYSNESHEIYLKWLKVSESLSYNFRQDLEFWYQDYDKIEKLWDCSHGHPVILRSYLGKKVNLETLVILNKIYKFTEFIDEQLILDPVWSTVSILLHKYSPFIKIDKEKYSMIIRRVFG